MNTKRLIPVILPMALATGCIGATRYSGSRAEEPAGSRDWHPRQIKTLHLQGVTLEIQVQNVRPTRNQVGFLLPFLPLPGAGPLKPPLKIWIGVTPGEGPVRFDPGGAVLRMEGEGDLLPRGYWGPGTGGKRMWGGPWFHYGCGTPRKPLKPKKLSQPMTARTIRFRDCFNSPGSRSPIRHADASLLVREPTCFVLLFDASPSPKRDFTVRIDGVTRDGVPVPVPEIRYTKGVYWEWEVLFPE